MSTLADPHDPSRNRLISALPRAEYERLRPHLERVSFSLGQVVYESGGPLTHVYFPTTAIVSMLYVTEDGSSAETGVAGREGLVGVALYMGDDSTTSRAVVRSAGAALRMRAKVLQDEFRRGGELQRRLLRYTQALIAQISQTAVCNCHHTVGQRLCRSLLMSRDLLDSDEVVMTQELIAGMLGVRREGVTVAAGRLQEQGLIRYARGHIRVLDRRGLEAEVCECYRVVRDEYERLLGR